jgi:hypothetical protein
VRLRAGRHPRRITSLGGQRSVQGSEQGPAPCLQRVGKLYLPSGGTLFACRDCYDLTYQSCRNSRDGTAMWRVLAADTGIPFQAVKRMMDEDDRERSCLDRNQKQRAVFVEPPKNSDIPSTLMGVVEYGRRDPMAVNQTAKPGRRDVECSSEFRSGQWSAKLPAHDRVLLVILDPLPPLLRWEHISYILRV